MTVTVCGPQMQLFPGLWFSHAGQVTSLELVVQPSSTSSSARIQILRPYCNPNYHLVPPGKIQFILISVNVTHPKDNILSLLL